MKRIRKISILFVVFFAFFVLSGCQESNSAKYEQAQKLLTEGKYSEAVMLFDEIKTYEDSSKMAMYGRAIASAESGDYEAAFSSFSALGDYKDCPLMLIYYKARQYEFQATSEIWELWNEAASTYDSIGLFLDSKDRADNCRKKIYDEAVNIANSGEYARSISLLETIRFFEDSPNLISYYRAYEMESNNQFMAASDAFAALGDYKDSKAQAEQVLMRGYEKADTLEKAGDQAAAYCIFADLEDYRDAHTRAGKLCYVNALSKRDAHNWEAAIAAFELAADYEDSSIQILVTRYMEGIVKRENEDWEGARKAFELAGDYSDAATQIYATYYEEGKADLDAGNINGALVAFNKSQGYNDADTQIQLIVSQSEENKFYGATITIAGSVSFDGEVLKNSCLTDSQIYDFSDVLSLLKNELQSDLNVVFLENIISDDDKVSDTITPASVARALRNAGFQMAACGFANAWAKESTGVSATRMNLRENGITPVGVYETENPNRVNITEIRGIPVAILQYTDTISASTRKKMEKKDESDTVPAAEIGIIVSDIKEARNRGAEAVIVLMNWGKVGKAPDKTQKALAQSIADAGADLIVGAGSRIPQGAEYLTGQLTDGSERKILCIWSLGTTLSGDRTNINKMSGYLLHIRIQLTQDGKVAMEQPEYTPVYTWRYRQDGRYYYRCLAANQAPPDGMDNEQIKNMDKAADATRAVLEGAPLNER